MKNSISIDFIIPVYNDYKLTEICIRNIRKYHDNNIIVVLDGDYKDKKKLKKVCKKYNCEFLCHYHNSGFSYTANQGIYHSKADICLVMNNDVLLVHDINKEIRKRFKKDKTLGILGFLLYYPDGRIQHGGLDLHPNGKDFCHIEYGVMDREAKDSFCNKYIICVTGALMAIRKKMIDDIGAFGSRYVLAFEDTEICLRAWANGWRVYYSADIEAFHAEGATRGRTVQEKQNRNTLILEAKSHEKYLEDISKFNIREMIKGIEVLNADRDK